MELSHFSPDPLITPHSTPQQADVFFKPKGLWVSVDGDDDWPTWCRNENYGDIDAKHRHQVTLARDVLVLSTVDEIRAFDATYGVNYLTTGDRYDGVDWLRVSRTWPGVIIAPYQWGLRFDRVVSWYYPWDCASGCIWDTTAIESVELITEAATSNV